MSPHSNPYRTDYPGAGFFCGRASEIALLVQAMRTGRQSLAAIMAGRGMGKTSLAIRVHAELAADASAEVHLIRKVSADPLDFLSQIAVRLGRPLDATLPVESLVEGVRAVRAERVTLIADEIDGLLASAPGRSLLEALRIAWEELQGKLGVVVLGGSTLRAPLSGGSSPFLRAAQWIPLKGLSLEDAADLIREPLHLDAPDPLVEVLWAQTGGHPLLLQAILERAVALGEPVLDKLPEAVRETVNERLEPTLFPIWWDNLGEGGQAVYRSLLAHPAPVSRDDRTRVLGPGSQAWIEVLETTGVVRSEGGQIVPRCELFRNWAEQHHPRTSQGAPPSDRRLPEMLRSFGAHVFEELIVSAIARWARSWPAAPCSGRVRQTRQVIPRS